MNPAGAWIPMHAWSRFGAACTHYEKRGYVYTDTPWLVRKEEYYATRPQGANPLYVPTWDRYLVASAEQGFLGQMFDGAGFNSVMSVTPCFRDEPVFDHTHLPYFMKLELLSTTKSVEEVVEDARSFMCAYAPVNVVTTEAGLDLEVDGIEVGSYGTRTRAGLTWVYGTGLAEPRFTFACERQPACSWDYEATVRDVIAAYPEQVHNYVIGKTAFGFLFGQAMKATKGRANPQVLEDELRRQLHVLRVKYTHEVVAGVDKL